MFEGVAWKLRCLMGPERWRVFNALKNPAWIGTLRRTTPLSRNYGFDRGTPVDRYYIGQFLEKHKHDIRGSVLEIFNSVYTEQFGSGIEKSEVLDIDGTNRNATIVADLCAADSIDSNSFDCFILTQTLQYIYEARAAIVHARRILKPGGVLLATVPTISKIERIGVTDFWRFTADSCRRLFGEVFGFENVTVGSYGNVLSGLAFWVGMAQEELSRRELEANDPDFPTIVSIRATKRGSNAT